MNIVIARKEKQLFTMNQTLLAIREDSCICFLIHLFPFLLPSCYSSPLPPTPPIASFNTDPNSV